MSESTGSVQQMDDPYDLARIRRAEQAAKREGAAPAVEPVAYCVRSNGQRTRVEMNVDTGEWSLPELLMLNLPDLPPLTREKAIDAAYRVNQRKQRMDVLRSELNGLTTDPIVVSL